LIDLFINLLNCLIVCDGIMPKLKNKTGRFIYTMNISYYTLTLFTWIMMLNQFHITIVYFKWIVLYKKVKSLAGEI